MERPLDIPVRFDREGSVQHFRDGLAELNRRFGSQLLTTQAHTIHQANHLHAKVRTVRGRARALRTQIVELERELAANEAQAIGYERAVEGLLRDMAGRLEQEMARIERETGSPAWSPWPAYGFRLWQIGDDGLYGAWARWPEPEITAECRSERVGTDIPVPHLNDVCGPPSCGIYAVKDLGDLLEAFDHADYTHLAVGLVAVTGRVIEHARAYRAQHARVVAVVATVGRRLLITDDRQRIYELFDDPVQASLSFPDVAVPIATLDPRGVEFLTQQERSRTEWTSESNNE